MLNVFCLINLSISKGIMFNTVKYKSKLTETKHAYERMLLRDVQSADWGPNAALRPFFCGLKPSC